MTLRVFAAAGLALALAGCTTIAPQQQNAVEARWAGQPAGVFFAQFGPPTADVQSGGNTLYSWKGGYRNRKVPATYAKKPDGSRGKQTSPARTDYLSCSVQLTVSSDYVIRSVRLVGDRRQPGGPSWCEEVLAGAKAS
ncbi:hypothetical protein C8J36_10128 [Rhizobium sp. PP-F2F-G48]|uniref:hypothetical protein n=1 Tax=Rhizobium sp. PP-F2F-G48 TaxID=2135651 RepID=UPI00104D1231|nr:hypothetical protein [Rhizobium sp. PP-F2F-G48]TCM58131.1 hypothetical protein C8J36_10128 [Rhizobium sp. PP-F2F-G48]